MKKKRYFQSQNANIFCSWIKKESMFGCLVFFFIDIEKMLYVICMDRLSEKGMF